MKIWNGFQFASVALQVTVASVCPVSNKIILNCNKHTFLCGSNIFICSYVLQRNKMKLRCVWLKVYILVFKMYELVAPFIVITKYVVHTAAVP